MIKLKNLIFEIISEKMTYGDLMKISDPERKDKSSRIPAKSMIVKSNNDKEAWKFSYKTPSQENTTGMRHNGFIYFYKENIKPGDDAMKIPCSVDCGCPDYKYRFSYSNKQQDAGENGPNSLNKGLNYPSSINRGPGLCKHLLSLKEYLRTNIETGEDQKPEILPQSPPEETLPAEEPVPEDPTQAPEEPEQKEPTEPEQPEDPTQTPQEPDEEEKPEKLKEQKNKIDLYKSLDEFCRKNPVFII